MTKRNDIRIATLITRNKRQLSPDDSWLMSNRPLEAGVTNEGRGINGDNIMGAHSCIFDNNMLTVSSTILAQSGIPYSE